MPLQKKLKQLSVILVVTIAASVILVLAGWLFKIDLLTRLMGGSVQMNPLTALTFIIWSAGFLFFNGENISQNKKRLTLLVAVIIIIIIMLRLFYAASLLSFQIDHLLFADKIGSTGVMRVNTAVCFLLAAVALGMMLLQNSKGWLGAQLSALLIMLLAWLSLLGYLYEVNYELSLLFHFSMSIHTAFCFILVAGAVFFQTSDKSLMREVTSTYTGSSILRFLLPAAVLIPTFFGYIRLALHRYNLVDVEIGTAILIFALIVVFLWVIWYLSVTVNKRDRLRAESEASIKYLANLVEQTSDAMISTDEQLRIKTWNKGAEKMYGFREAEVKGKIVGDVIRLNVSDESRNSSLSELNQKGSYVSEYTATRKDNEEFAIMATVSALRDETDAVTGYVATHKDISNEKQAQKEVEKIRQRFYSFMEKIPVMAWLIDAEGVFLYVNPLYDQVFGEGQSVIGRNIKEVFPNEFLDDYVANNKQVLDENRIINTIEKAILPGDKLMIAKVIKFPVPDNNGMNLVGGIAVDITEQVHNEEQLKETNRKLEITNRELEQFAFVASHDLQEPLRMVNSFLQLLEKKYGHQFDETASRYINFAVDGATRMKALVTDLLNFSTIGADHPGDEQVELVKIVETVLQDHQLLIADHKAVVEVQDLPVIKANRGQLDQLYRNLIGNALKYRHPERPPRIQIGVEVMDGIEQFYVKDNGIGIKKEYADKIFVIFQRLHTREQYDGTGIGLAICKKIVEQRGGQIWVESEPGVGSCFYFTFSKPS